MQIICLKDTWLVNKNESKISFLCIVPLTSCVNCWARCYLKSLAVITFYETMNFFYSTYKLSKVTQLPLTKNINNKIVTCWFFICSRCSKWTGKILLIFRKKIKAKASFQQPISIEFTISLARGWIILSLFHYFRKFLSKTTWDHHILSSVCFFSCSLSISAVICLSFDWDAMGFLHCYTSHPPSNTTFPNWCMSCIFRSLSKHLLLIPSWSDDKN